MNEIAGLPPMMYEAMKCRLCDDPTCWRVEAIDDEGEGDCYLAIFTGPRSEERAKEYAGRMNDAQRLSNLTCSTIISMQDCGCL